MWVITLFSDKLHYTEISAATFLVRGPILPLSSCLRLVKKV